MIPPTNKQLEREKYKMANAPTTTEVSTKPKVSKIGRLSSIAADIAKGISKVQLTPEEITALEQVAELLFSTVTHSKLLAKHVPSKAAAEAEAE